MKHEPRPVHFDVSTTENRNKTWSNTVYRHSKSQRSYNHFFLMHKGSITEIPKTQRFYFSLNTFRISISYKIDKDFVSFNSQNLLFLITQLNINGFFQIRFFCKFRVWVNYHTSCTSGPLSSFVGICIWVRSSICFLLSSSL